MTAVAFEHTAPATLDGALRALAAPGRTATPLAGGQSLVPLLMARQVRPDVVVDLTGIPGLARITVGPDRVRIGAMTTLRTLERHAELAAALPVLGRAAAAVAHPHIRRRATLGGSLCHAAPAAELPAVAVALGAEVVLRSPRGTRSVPADRFATGAHATVRAPDEVATEIAFPRATGLTHEFHELCARGDTGYPVAGVCLGLRSGDGRVRAARVVVTGCGHVPARLPGVEARLTGRPVAGPHPGLIAAVVAEAAGHLGPPDGAYRAEVAGVLLLRALAAHTEGAAR